MNIEKLVKLRLENKTWTEIAKSFKGHSANALRKAFYRAVRDNKSVNPVKILVLDIETSPLVSYTWGTFDQNVALNQIVEDWSILAWAGKWVGNDQIHYMDTRKEKNPRNDKKILKRLWTLLDEADIVLGQNVARFDIKKINARFILNGMTPPSSYRVIDTLKIAKRHFAFTSNKLEYMSKQLCTNNQKSSHDEFSGFKLWSECLNGNIKAWQSMEKYNIQDVISTEELYHKLKPWDKTINLNVYHEELEFVCSCGSTKFKKHKKAAFTNTGKFNRFICQKCGAESFEKENTLSPEKKKSLRK